MFPVLARFGDGWLSSYGALGALGFTLAVIVGVREARRVGVPAGRIVDLAFWLLVAGLVGGRLLFAATNADVFVDACREAPGLRACTRVLHVWAGGLAWYGSVIGAALVAWWWLGRHRLPVLPVLDAVAPAIALGHAVGRIGCFAAGCCYGRVGPEGPFTVRFGPGSLALLEGRQQGWVELFADRTPPLYAVQLGEAAAELLLFGALIVLAPRKRFHGQVLASYLMAYALARAVLEHWRGDASRGGFAGASTSQWIALATAAVGAMVWARGRARAPMP